MSKTKKGDKGTGCCRNVCFIAVTVILRSICFLRQGYLRMSQQRDLPESMAWRVISRTLLESPEVLLQIETGNVRRRPVASATRHYIDDRYIQLTARRNRTDNASCSWQHDEGCPAKQ
ncbi:hypothetical protein TNCV_1938601 [Trichonephila clavipes]|nr:hypothetical protein TNCV_1938601 [Trichonephila clavipes]